MAGIITLADPSSILERRAAEHIAANAMELWVAAEARLKRGFQKRVALATSVHLLKFLHPPAVPEIHQRRPGLFFE